MGNYVRLLHDGGDEPTPERYLRFTHDAKEVEATIEEALQGDEADGDQDDYPIESEKPSAVVHDLSTTAEVAQVMIKFSLDKQGE